MLLAINMICISPVYFCNLITNFTDHVLLVTFKHVTDLFTNWSLSSDIK